jgi:nitrous oxidase accessory protein
MNRRKLGVGLALSVLALSALASSRPKEVDWREPKAPLADAGPSLVALPASFVVAQDSVELQRLLDDPAGPRQVGVRGAAYHGAVVIRRPVVLRGDGTAVIDGAGVGSVLSIESDDVSVENLSVRHSGHRQTTEDAGIRAKGARISVIDVRVEDSLFGISFGPCLRCLIDHSRVEGLSGVDAELRGDGIKLWESSDSVVKRSVVEDARDVVVWYSRRVTLDSNTVRRCRYGTHLMYAHDSSVQNSRLEGNVVGIFSMYSGRLHVERNVLAFARGAAGMGIGFKESDGVDLTGNWIVGNTTGVYLDRTPHTASQAVTFSDNMIALNEVALGFLGSEAGLSFERNDFHQNVALVDFDAEGEPLRARFSHNHWTEYAGYDLNADSVGDVPFELKQLSRELGDSTPSLKLFQGTVAFGMIDAIAHVVPVLSSRILLTDPNPEVSSPLTVMRQP